MGQPTEPPTIGEALLSIRAAMDLVASGAALRVTVAIASCDDILPAARALARVAGLTLEEQRWSDGEGCEFGVSREPQQLRRRDGTLDERGAPRVAS